MVLLVRQLPWTHNLIIFTQSTHPEKREFYLRMANFWNMEQTRT